MKIYTLIVLIGLVSLINGQPTKRCNMARPDPKFNLFLYDDVMTCFKSIPFNRTVQQHTIDNLRIHMSLYAFKNIAINSPDPNIPMKIDLMQELDRIKDTHYDYDYQFHADLSETFLRLKDAHTTYSYPSNYASQTFYQPIPITSVELQAGNLPRNAQQHNLYPGEQIAQIVGVNEFMNGALVNFYSQQFNQNFSNLENGIILEINGHDAINYLRNFADKKVGVSKDLGARFNIAVFPESGAYGFGIFGFRNSHYCNLPLDEKFVLYKILLQNGQVQTIKVPFVVGGQQYTSYQDWHEDYLRFDPFGFNKNNAKAQVAPINNAKVNNQFELFTDIMNDEHVQKHKFSSPNMLQPWYSYFTKSNAGADYCSGDFITCDDSAKVLKLDNQTVVVQIKTFAPQDLQSFKTVLKDGLNTAHHQGLTHVILDLVYNGGGDICLFSSVARLFHNGADNGVATSSPSDMVSNNFSRSLAQYAYDHGIDGSFWSGSNYQDLNGNGLEGTIDWMVPGVQKVRGGKPDTFSKLVGLNMELCEPEKIIKPEGLVFKPKYILIMTYGLCGSTCSLFSSHLHNYDHVETVAIGGLKDRTMSYTSFPGGQVLSMDALFSQYNVLKVSGQPEEFITSASFRLAAREVYFGDHQDRPLEFTFQPATYHIPQTPESVKNPSLNWKRTQRFFPDYKIQGLE